MIERQVDNDKEDVELLKRFLLENKEFEELEDIINDFNIFTALKLRYNESTHSDFLSWLMNPIETHGTGDYFLKSFLKLATFQASSLLGSQEPSIFEIDSWDLDQSTVEREKNNIDIFIRNDEYKLVCVIENKIYSSEHSGQLKRYKEYIEKEYPHYKKLFIYLTVEGEHPENDIDYLPMSYAEIITLIEHLLDTRKDKLNSVIVSFILHYTEMLRRYIMQDSQIQDLCRSIYTNHKRALELIFEHKPDRQIEIREIIEKIIKNDPELILDSSSKTYIHFIPKNLDFVPSVGEGWTKSKRILLFEIYNGIDRVSIYLIIGPGPQEIRQSLYQIAQNNSMLFQRAKRALTPSWYSIHTAQWLNKKEIEEFGQAEIEQAIANKLKLLKEVDLPKFVSELQKFKMADTTQ